MSDTSPALTHHRTSDGITLAVDRYTAQALPKAHVLIVHGYLEHAGRYARFAKSLNAADFSCSVLELRGHGRSEGPRAHVDHFADYVTDVAEVVDAVRPSVEGLPLFVFGHSLGGLIVSHFAQTHGDRLDGVLLSNPYLGNAMPIPIAKQWLGRIAHRLVPRLKAPAGLKREWMSRDAAALDAMASDDAIQRYATAGWFHEVTSAQQAVADFRRWECPLWIGIGDADPVASPTIARQFAERLLAPEKTIKMYAGALHELLQDLVADEMHADVIRWLQARAATSNHV